MLRLFFVFSAQGAPREDSLCGLRYSSVHHREVGVSRSDLRRAQGQTARTWPLRSRWLGPEVRSALTLARDPALEREKDIMQPAFTLPGQLD